MAEAYAEDGDVTTLAGKIAAGWDPTGVPGEGDVSVFLDQIAQQLDGAIASHGLPVPVTDATARGSLRLPNALGALVLMIRATYRGAIPDDLDAAYKDARDDYRHALNSLRDGTHEAVSLLVDAAAGGGISSFWGDNPAYGTATLPDGTNFVLEPSFRKGQSL